MDFNLLVCSCACNSLLAKTECSAIQKHAGYSVATNPERHCFVDSEHHVVFSGCLFGC